MQKGGDISFLGDLFSDYQSYWYAKRVVFGDVYEIGTTKEKRYYMKKTSIDGVSEKGISDKIASYLDVRHAFKNPVFLKLMEEETSIAKNLMSRTIELLNAADFNLCHSIDVFDLL